MPVAKFVFGDYDWHTDRKVLSQKTGWHRLIAERRAVSGFAIGHGAYHKFPTGYDAWPVSQPCDPAHGARKFQEPV